MPDLTEARSSLSAFADMAGHPLTDWQAQALDLEAPVTVVIGARGVGKSRALALLALHRAFRNVSHVLIVSASEASARRLLSTVRAIATASDLLAGSVVDEQAALLTLSNGSTIRSVPASERAIRGWAVDLLLLDEAAYIPEELLQAAAIPTTTARPDSRIVLASTAGVAGGAFFDFATLGDQGSEHVRTHRWRYEDCPWISPTYIEQRRSSMPTLLFRAEYEGEFVGEADSLFTRQAIERVTADYRPLSLAELNGPARLLLGVDWGATIDRSVAVAIARLPEAGERRFGIVCCRRFEQGASKDRVVEEVVSSPAAWRRISSERTGLGHHPTMDLFRAVRERPRNLGGGLRQDAVVLSAHEFLELGAEPPHIENFTTGELEYKQRPARRDFETSLAAIATTAELKAGIYGALHMLIDRGQLLLPASCGELIRELLMLRVDLSPSGAARFEASRGHDDCADSLALATGPYRDGQNRHRVWLADLADSRHRVPEPELDLSDREAETVKTGAGLELPREPVMQSVAGSELTLPETFKRAERPAKSVRERAAELVPATT